MVKSCTAAEGKVCGIFAFEVLKIPFVFSVAQSEKTHKQRLPPRGSWRRRRLRDCCSNAEKPRFFAVFSVSQSPSVTLARASFLSEEGSWQRAAVPQKNSVQILGFEGAFFLLVFFVSQRKKHAQIIGSLREGAPAKRVRDCLESTKSVKIHSRLCGTNPLPAEPQHPSVSRSADSSPLKKRAAYSVSDCGAKKEKCAAFPSRGLLPSR